MTADQETTVISDIVSPMVQAGILKFDELPKAVKIARDVLKTPEVAARVEPEPKKAKAIWALAPALLLLL